MRKLDAFTQASDAHVRLNTFYAVIAILEGGMLPGGSSSANQTAQKIIALCKTEAQRQLDVYDAARAALKEADNADKR